MKMIRRVVEPKVLEDVLSVFFLLKNDMACSFHLIIIVKLDKEEYRGLTKSFYPTESIGNNAFKDGWK